MPQEKANIERLKAEHGEVYVLRAGSGEEVVCRTPDEATWQRFLDERMNERSAPRALRRLLEGCLLHPDAPGFDAIIARRPGLANVFAMKVVELAGLAEECEAKKA